MGDTSPKDQSPVKFPSASSSSSSSSILASLSSVPNVSNQLSVKLNSTNYILWKTQMLPILRGYNLENHIDKNFTPPPSTLNGQSNPEFTTWYFEDQIVLGWINSSLSESMLADVVGVSSALEAWTCLEASFAAGCRTQTRHLKSAIHHLQRNNTESIEAYLLRARTLLNQLRALQGTMADEDFVGAILDGLGQDYRPFTRSIEARLQPVSFNELRGLLLSEEQQLQKFDATVHMSPATALYSSRDTSGYRQQSGNRGRGGRSGRGGGGRYYGGGRSSGSGRMSDFRQSDSFSKNSTSAGSVICYNCNGTGHMSRQCPSPRKTPQAHHVAPSSQAAQPWIVDSGATHHLTGALNNLSIDAEYTGPDEVMVSNGNSIPISHVGNTVLCDNSRFRLNNILYSSQSPFSLLSANSFARDNCVSLELFPDYFLVKDIRTRRVLHKGPVDRGLYKFFPVKSSLISAHHVSFRCWHSRLGHAHDKAVISTLKSNNIACSVNKNSLCSACCVSKSHRLPYSSSNYVASAPLELICSDVWGPAPVVSSNGNRYYVLFYDHFSKYSWIYCLQHKSDVYATFVKFKAFVEKFFDSKIKIFQCDWGGEFRSLVPFLSDNGISLRVSCPHTPQQNGCVERKHRHVVETGLALLNHASVPLQFWDYAFETAVYAINRLVTPLLPHMSPFARLFGKQPNLHALRTFGCICYPFTRPYNKNKLENRSVMCLFVGYSTIHKGYKCLDVVRNRLYISRDVVFDELNYYFPKQQVAAPGLSRFVQNMESGILGPPPAPLNKTCRIFPPITNASLQDPSLGFPSFQPVTPTNTSASLELVDFVAPRGELQEAGSTVLPADASDRFVPSVTLPVSSSTAVSNVHPMQTRSKTGNSRPKLLAAITPPRQPGSVSEAKKFKEWRAAMDDELNSLIKLGTWDLVVPPKDANLVGCKWVFRVKENADGSIARYKARLVAKGFHQRPGVDYLETFSPVVKPTTIRLVLGIAVTNKWTVTQYDVSNAFLHGTLDEDVYMVQPPGFVDSSKPNYVCKLHRSLYGLKQAPRQWNNCLKEALISCGFVQSHLDHSLFVLRSGASVLYCLTYVDDLLLTGNDLKMASDVEGKLGDRFLLKNLGQLNYFLGVQATWKGNSLFLSQTKYINDLLHRVQMTSSKAVSTPAAVTHSKSTELTTAFSDTTLYRSTLGRLQYLSFTRPEIGYSVNKLAQYMHSPMVSHWQEVKRILRYLQGTAGFGITISPTSLTKLNAYSDADWAGSVDDRKSTTGYAIYLGCNLVSWSSRKQKSVSRSSTEAEYRALANTTSEVIWIQNMMAELGITVQIPLLWCDNLGATNLTVNPVYHSRMKHVQIDVHFVRDQVAQKKLTVCYLSTKDQIADILTKPLSKGRFLQLRDKLTISSPG